jgi:penicillin-binding protein 1A
MSDAELPRLPRIAPPGESPGGVVVPLRPSDRKALDHRERRRAVREARRHRPPRIMRWRRLWLLMIPIGVLSLVSMVFGFVVAVASQLPSLNHFIIAANPQNSLIYDDDGHRVAVMTDDLHRAYYVPPNEIPELMKRAIISIEDKRFYLESGVDIKGLARAFLNDVTGSGTTQGASTITEQLVKVINKAEFHRTLFEKLTEAALAFQLSHKYTKDQILGAYLNDVYYGNGAYGIEAAAQTYFGSDPTSNLYGCGYTPGNPGNLCVQKLTPAEAALLAGLVNNPPTNWGYDIQQYEQARRNLVLLDMYEQGFIPLHGLGGYEQALATPLPQQEYVVAAGDEARNPGYGYFTSWVEQQILDDKKQLPNPYTAGYQIHTTLDEPLQNTAQNVVESILPPNSGLPEASLVAINNQTGGVMSMFGGYDYDTKQFNTATQAERQPGSAWKVFDLAKALEEGVSPNSMWPSGVWTYKGGPGPAFTIHNDEASYVGKRTLAAALTYSDNTVFARVGIDDGLRNVANYAHDFGITTDVSRNPAMTIGGLFTGVTPLDMAHAYSTIAHGGVLVSGTLASATCAGSITLPPRPTAPLTTAAATNALVLWKREQFGYQLQLKWKKDTCPGPTGITVVTTGKDAKTFLRNEPRYYQVPGFTTEMDQTEQAIMRTVVTEGTGTAADIPNFWVAGKTGTTSNYVDAWFVGFTQPMAGLPDGMTVAVWVGYNTPRSMGTLYGGKPVYGGTYPADIFKQFVEDAIQITTREAYDRAHKRSQTPLLTATEAPVSTIPFSSLPAYGTPSSTSTGTTGSTTTTAPTTTQTGTTAPTTGTNTPTAPAAPVTTSPGGGASAP